MKRREFSIQLAGAGLGLAVAGPSRAQGVPAEGRDYNKLGTPVSVTLPSPQKKVEVIEFFWYGCPHCFAFEPVLEPWAKQVPADVYFHQVPYAFLGPVEHQKTFYALEEIGQREAVHRKLFNALHVQKLRLNTESEIGAFLASNGVDAAKFSEAYKSFAVNTKVSRGKQLSSAYKIDSVPMIGIHGRYTAQATIDGSHQRALAVVDYLIQRSRQAA